MIKTSFNQFNHYHTRFISALFRETNESVQVFNHIDAQFTESKQILAGTEHF